MPVRTSPETSAFASEVVTLAVAQLMADVGAPPLTLDLWINLETAEPLDLMKVGGLMSYGADLVDNFRRAANYVHKIFKGVNPSKLPFEQPTKYSLAVSIKTAKTLVLAIPHSMVLRADEVIQ